MHNYSKLQDSQCFDYSLKVTNLLIFINFKNSNDYNNFKIILFTLQILTNYFTEFSTPFDCNSLKFY